MTFHLIAQSNESGIVYTLQMQLVLYPINFIINCI